MESGKVEQTGVNKGRPVSGSDTPLTQRRSGPVRYELIDKDGRVWATHPSAAQLGELAKLYFPDQKQDEDRTGKGWDIQIVGVE